MLLVAMLLVAGCQPAPVPPPVVVVDVACLVSRDSLAALLDSARAQLREQVVLVRLAEQQMMRYARIVQRDPTQSRFVVGWTRRAFSGVVP